MLFTREYAIERSMAWRPFRQLIYVIDQSIASKGKHCMYHLRGAVWSLLGGHYLRDSHIAKRHRSKKNRTLYAPLVAFWPQIRNEGGHVKRKDQISVKSLLFAA